MIDKPTFASKEAEIEWVFKNKDLLLLEKKNAIKHGDIVTNTIKEDIKTTTKAESIDETMIGKLRAELVINTTNLIDSHMDCHIDGIWNKSLKELGLLYLLQEHEMEFEYVIADSVNDELKANVKSIEWSKLGYNYEGKTQALIFSTTISKERNEFMYNQYKNGYVLNHSVGMRYVKMYLCVDSESPEYTQEKEAWNKYYPIVVNKEVADQKGYFWAVTEAKIVEGSAVVKGSNQATPTLSITENKDEAVINTSDENKDEPTLVTQRRNKGVLI
jgi:hypothetical protein